MALALAGSSTAAQQQQQQQQGHVAAAETNGDNAAATESVGREKTAPLVDNRFAKDGVVVDFSARPVAGRALDTDQISAADYVDLSFTVTDGATGEPLKGVAPGAWMDLTESWDGKKTVFTNCRERVGLYLQGLIGVRPLIDLNSYFILVMNSDPSISVIDPITGITGITKLYAQINLQHPGADWAKTADEKRFFVTMPKGDSLAVIDTDLFEVSDTVPAGENPQRIVLQPDGKYLWIGNDAEKQEASGVTIVAADSLESVGFIATGLGHHEITLSDDSRTALISNRDGGTVTIVDTATLSKAREIETGPLPIAIAYSGLSDSFYVADGESGEIVVIDARTREVTASIASVAGLGPIEFSQDGRWGVVVNPSQDVALVIDAATSRIVHRVPVGKQPYQVAFSRSFAYVRSLGTERVAMIDVSEMGKEGRPPVVTFGAGQRAPEQARDLSIADAIVEAPGEAAVMVVSPADATVYYYMEGMNAPMGNFRNYGHRPRAVQVVDRSMQEREPGVYSSTVRLPEAGVYQVAFLMDSPSILHCFEVAARPNPLLEIAGASIAVEYLDQPTRVKTDQPVTVRFRLTERKTANPRTDLVDVSVVYFAAPGGRRSEVPARHTENGVYEATVTPTAIGAYYLYPVCPSEEVGPNDLHFMTLVAGVPSRRGRGR